MSVAEIITIGSDDEKMLKKFLQTAGSSLLSFRYFAKRPLSIINNHLITALIIEDGNPIGYGHLDHDGGKIWLGIAISEKFKGMGYGKQMMNFLVSSASDRKLEAICLSVDKNNQSAIQLYKTYEFQIENELNESTLLMRKNISHGH